MKGLFLCMLLVLVLSPGRASAADPQAKDPQITDAAERIIRIHTGEYAPYVGMELKKGGVLAEVVRHAFKMQGYRAQFVFAPWARCESMVKEGRAVAAFPYFRNSQREEYARFSVPMATSTVVFFYDLRRMGLFRYKSLDNLRGLLIGGGRGYFYEPMFKEADLLVDYAYDMRASFRKLVHGRIDIVPENELVGRMILDTFPEGETRTIAVAQDPLSSDHLHLMVSKMHPGGNKVLNLFNQALGRMRQKGAYARICKDFGISESVLFQKVVK